MMVAVWIGNSLLAAVGQTFVHAFKMMNTDYIQVITENSSFRSVIAKKNIPTGTFLGDFWGEVGPVVHTYTVQIDTDKHIDPAGDTKYINHSCYPNAKFVYEIRDGVPVEKGHELAWHLVAARDIRKGEEVTFDYTTTEYDMAAPFDCRCGEELCIGRVQGFKYLDEKQMVRRLPLISPALQRLINNN